MTKAIKTLLSGFGTLTLDPSERIRSYRIRVDLEDRRRRNDLIKRLYLASLVEQHRTSKSRLNTG